MPRTMSVTPGNLSLNGTSFLSENHGIMDKPSEQRTWNAFLFCLTFAIALPALLGSIYSLVSLLKLQNKTTVSMIVTSLAADDLISIVPVIIFLLMQWSSEALPQPLCTTSAFMYLFQGISSNLKGSLIVSYNFYSLNTTGTLSCSSSRRRIQMAVQYISGLQSLSMETLSFLLSALAAAVTPLFVLSQHWLHLPCGCVINCRRNSYAPSQGATTKRSGFEFNLSFQQGCGIYRISLESPPQPSSDGKPSSFPSLAGSGCREPGRGSDSGSRALAHGSQGTPPAVPGPCQGQQGTSAAPPAFPEGPEWRLCHEESPTPELSDWEWCRSKSERNPRQRPGGALPVPLCAVQGTVSLQAPGGKTLSLSTYEVSSQGHRIAPAAKKIEVYRSKSVGHEPSPGQARDAWADTSVKIHLEVLEICDTEEALDTVSIVSNISQSSSARSPSLRYSRKENRFVCCELGESASYSLLIPSGSDFSISIPDTVEAHRRNSQPRPAAPGHREEIQLLNAAYRERDPHGDG
ncbi:probable G-protein coupled receptor 149 isoform X2 [Passer domesticus]|uniref:probable G-protein coupled receptor 149 isoform X2 n=1 Tax=Passer domesticus TaxID=48849 RepID=UPI0030FF0E70